MLRLTRRVSPGKSKSPHCSATISLTRRPRHRATRTIVRNWFPDQRQQQFELLRREDSRRLLALRPTLHSHKFDGILSQGLWVRGSSMSASFADLERHRFLSSRLVEELSRRRLPVEGGRGHCSKQFGTEATSLALLSLCSSPAGPFAMKK